jgi:hypothetical protein
MQNITLSIGLVNQIMAYLGNQPYQGVFGLIDAIQKEAQAQNTNPISTQEATPQASTSEAQ